MNTDEEVEV